MNSCSLFLQCFLWHYPFTTQSRLLTNLKKKPFENIVGRGENAGNTIFSPIPEYDFYPSNFSVKSIRSSANAFNLTSLKICCVVKNENIDQGLKSALGNSQNASENKKL